MAAQKRVLGAARRLGSARAWLHLVRMVNYYEYDHVGPLKRARLGGAVSISPTASFRNGDRIEIGARAHIGAYNHLWAGNREGRISIGEDALFGPFVFITASNYGTKAGTPVMRQQTVERDVVIGRDVWLGANATVLPGVTIGDGCVVGAGSVVTRDLPAGCIAVGTPARVVGQRSGPDA